MNKVISIRKDKTGIKLDDGQWYKLKGVALEKALTTELYKKNIIFDKNEEGIISLEIIKENNQEEHKDKIDWEAKDNRISRQNSLTQANKIIETLINNKIIENITSEKIESMLFEIAEKCNDFIWEKKDVLVSPKRDPKNAEMREEGLTLSPPPTVNEETDYYNFKKSNTGNGFLEYYTYVIRNKGYTIERVKELWDFYKGKKI